MSEPEQIACPYCGMLAKWLPDTAVYPRSYGGMVYVCLRCKAWVGCHKRKDGQPGTHALGRLADERLRKMKIQGHDLFYRLWKAAMEKRGWSKSKSRAHAYKWLSGDLFA